MGMQVCSLIYNADSDGQQIIKPGDYRIVRFPFGSHESYDGYNMHQEAQPDGVSTSFTQDRAGLIWPSVEGWADLYAMVFLDAGDYSEYRDRFVRDPLALTAKGPDSTATRDRRPSPGGQYVTKSWGIFVHPGTPLSLMVKHNGSSGVRLLCAEFKMAIHT